MTGSGSQIPRRHKRHPLPSSLAVVSAELITNRGDRHVGKLWDISPNGTCLVLSGSQDIYPAEEGVLRVQDPHSPETLQLRVQVRWVEGAGRVTFLGCQFDRGQLPKGTFLEPYFKVSWVDAMELYKLDGLE